MNEVTGNLLHRASIDEALGRKLTKEQRVLLLLSDDGWHSGRELALKVSHRFGGYLFTLKEQGVEWEKRRQDDAPKGEVWYEYRLTPDGQPSLF